MASRGLIGDMLVEKGIITQDQLNIVLKERKGTNLKVGELIVQNGYASEEDIAKVLSEQLGFSFIDLATYQIDPDAISMVSAELAFKLEAIPIFKIGDTLSVAMANPLDVSVIDELTRITGSLRIKSLIATPTGIKDAIARFYGSGFVVEKEKPGESKEQVLADGSLGGADDAEQAAVIKLVNKIIEDGLDMGASDIHLESQEDDFYCRMRVDGILHDMKPLPKDHRRAIISRIKIMAEMNIAQSRLPEDGRIQTKALGKDVDLRIASFPTMHGEHIAIRILDKSKGIFKLEELGFDEGDLRKLLDLIYQPYGMVLLTGPTGTGKSTTLYAMLNVINDLKKNIVTLEDPIEYTIKRINQSQVNVKAGFTFANGLRSLLRLDPDIIMIGEIRDRETADIAVHAALTGHLVFSTLHTNDAASAATRLIDIGVEPYLVSSSLIGVIAQRLVRNLCPKCKKEYKPGAKELAVLSGESKLADHVKVYEHEGCKQCRNIGYKGRTSIFELLVINNDIKELITKKSPSYELKQAALKSGMRALQQNGIAKVMQGVTSLSEVLRVTEEL